MKIRQNSSSTIFSSLPTDEPEKCVKAEILMWCSLTLNIVNKFHSLKFGIFKLLGAFQTKFSPLLVMKTLSFPLLHL